ncbi:MAG TPA: LpxD N-terminal domain-containing protein, partial [Ignavibacteriaceae bacterium]
MVSITAKEIAVLVNGKISGNENASFNSVARINEAKQNQLTFLYLPAYEKYFPSTQASAILVKNGFNKTRTDITYIEVEAPDKAFAKVIETYFLPEFKLEGIDSTAFVHKTAGLGKNVSLGRNVVVSAGCRIGNNAKIFHNTVLLEYVEIGDDTIV